MNEIRLKQGMGYLAKKWIPEDVDLWPEIRRQYEECLAGRGEKKERHPAHPRVNRRLSLTGIVTLAVLLLAGAWILTPMGNSFAQGVLHFFDLRDADEFPAPTDVPAIWTNPTPGVAAPTLTPWPGPAFAGVCGSYMDPNCTVEQIRGMVDFPILELGTIPANVYFAGATGGPDMVGLLYKPVDQQGFIFLWESPWSGDPSEKWQVGPSAVVESVQIGDLIGEYVRGSFGYFDGQPLVTWDSNADAQTLSWVADGVYLELQSAGSAMPFDRDQMVALAESMTDQPVSSLTTPLPLEPTPTWEILDMHTVYPLTLAEVEEKAGYPLILPAELPTILSYLGANYDEDLQAARVYYSLNQDPRGPNTNGLVVMQQPIPASGDCALCGFTRQDTLGLDEGKDGKIVPDFSLVQVGEVTGEFVAGNWQNFNQETNSWTWNPDRYLKQLRWQKDGMAFEISYFGNEIDEEDMIRIAESFE
jgi:hypothetical protein